jgi:2-amino-4-hydroxy-6-hydroxymethyldihydropteridine diphosphokinase
MRRWPELTGFACSQVYQTVYVGPGEQDDYWNLCCRAVVELDAPTILERIAALEARAGRADRTHMRPRPLDIDLLLHRGEKCDSRDLVLPHPRLHLRRFVLEPLADLDPALRVGPKGQSVADRLRDPEVRAQRVTPLGPAEDWLQLQGELLP